MISRTGRRIADFIPALRPGLQQINRASLQLQTSIGERWPQLVRARTEKITIAITAHCNLRCTGCRYGRDFMPGSILPAELVYGVLEDAAGAGIPAVRLYGGEPLLHPDLSKMVRRATELGVDAYVTTNALVLDRKIDALVDAGLKKVTIGYYGEGAAYDRYVQRPGRYARLIESLEGVRRRHDPDRLKLQFNFLLSRPSCDVEAFDAVHRLARRFGARIQIDIVHYSLPYFQEGPDRSLQFEPGDRGRVERLVEHLLQVKGREPEVLTESPASLASIADWAIAGPAMRVPCDAGKLLWIGADGSVQLCYVAFELGNLHRHRLRDLLYGDRHHAAARDAFKLNCPNCHCERGARVEKHAATYAAYQARAVGAADR
jgi:MoaA/NifB/PqqE/SkfB family radical SAM enzyme